MYPPYHNAGAELMLHTLLRNLVSRQHEVRVLVSRSSHTTYTHEGVTISRPSTREVTKWYQWADLVITHLDLTQTAMRFSRTHDKPLVHIIHNDKQLAYHRVTPADAALVIFNSQWIARAVPWSGRSIIITPPVVAQDYATTPGESLTLINLSYSKGAELFYTLAARFPDRPFLGVKGSYAQQIVPRILPPNVTIAPNTPDMKSIYSQTRILLMPSDYESWGRVAVEAAASSIPTIAHPTPGLKEALGDAGTFRNRDSADGWVDAILSLDNPVAYQRRADLSLRRSRQLNPEPSFVLFERSLRRLI